MSKNKAIICVIMSALIYGLTPIFCSYTYEMGNNAYSLTFFRSALVVPVLFFLMIKNSISFRLTLKEAINIIIVALSGSVITTLLLYNSYNYIDVGTATTLHFLYPLFIIITHYLVFKVKITRLQFLSLIISILGIMCFINLNNMTKLTGVIMALISGLTFAVYLLGIDKFGLSKMHGYKLSFYLALIVTMVLFILNIFTNEIIFVQPIESYLLMLIVAILAQFIAVILLKVGINVIGSSLVSLLSMFEPVSAMIFSVVLLSESVSLKQIIGSILIMTSVALLLKKSKKKV